MLSTSAVMAVVTTPHTFTLEYMPSLPSKTCAILKDTLNCVAGEAIHDVGVSTCVYKVANPQEETLNNK